MYRAILKNGKWIELDQKQMNIVCKSLKNGETPILVFSNGFGSCLLIKTDEIVAISEEFYQGDVK